LGIEHVYQTSSNSQSRREGESSIHRFISSFLFLLTSELFRTNSVVLHVAKAMPVAQLIFHILFVGPLDTKISNKWPDGMSVAYLPIEIAFD
jgi:hypothetical protein